MNGQATTERPQVAPARWEAAVCSWPDNEARDWARDLMQAARHNGTVNAVVATGSAVRDVDRSDDLDLVLVYHTVRPPLPKAPISVDLRCLRPSRRGLPTGRRSQLPVVGGALRADPV